MLCRRCSKGDQTTIKATITDWATRSVLQLAADHSVQAQNVSVETHGDAWIVQTALRFGDVPSISDSNITAALNLAVPSLITRLSEANVHARCDVDVSDTRECFSGFNNCGLCLQAGSTFQCEQFSNILTGRQVLFNALKC